MAFEFEMDPKVIAGVRAQVQAMRDAGSTIHYMDARWPGRTIREYPDGRRMFVELDRERGLFEAGPVDDLSVALS